MPDGMIGIFPISFATHQARIKNYWVCDLRSSQNQFALILWVPQTPLPHNSHERLSNLFLMLIDCGITNSHFVEKIEKRSQKLGIYGGGNTYREAVLLTNKIETPSTRKASDLMRALIPQVVAVRFGIFSLTKNAIIHWRWAFLTWWWRSRQPNSITEDKKNERLVLSKTWLCLLLIQEKYIKNIKTSALYCDLNTKYWINILLKFIWIFWLLVDVFFLPCSPNQFNQSSPIESQVKTT